ncbi:MAG: 8-amino-7-oxononanoate synthase [Coxiellaceae bacterium]|nr:8-amino-7-oxononanoate synthase [Coxiellaceae bacterium]
MPPSTSTNLKQLEQQHLRRKRCVVEERKKNITVIDGQALLNFASNDYLGMSQHPDIKKQFAAAALQYGLGSGSSALICGYHAAQQQLEQQFSQLIGCESSLYFNSGYHANLAVITALADRHSVIFSDKHCHASLLDGIQLSRAKHYRFKHHDLDHLQQLLKQHPGKDCLIVSESVFSMEGSITDVTHLSHLAQQYDARLLIDDAHNAFITESKSLNSVDVRINPFGKAIGSVGAMVSGNDDLIQTLLQFGNSYRYTTALPPAIAEATSVALSLIENENWRQQKLKRNIETCLQLCQQYELPLTNTDKTPIMCVYVGDNKKTLTLQQRLMDCGFFVAAIRPPTVENNKAILRLSLNCDHTTDEINQLIQSINEAYYVD